MAKTMVEKIFSKKLGRDVRPGENVFLSPDKIIMYEWSSISDYVFDLVENDLGCKNVDWSKLLLFIDHKLPAQNEKEQEFHLETLKWGKEHDVEVFYGEGIGHQITAERGFVLPGDVAVHFDRHVNLLGAQGVFSVGTRLELIMSFVKDAFPIQVPRTVRAELIGELQPGVMGRDLLHYIVKDIGPGGSPDCVLELGGPGALSISMDARLCLCGLALFVGATTAMFETDQVTEDYYKNIGKSIDTFVADKDADYFLKRTYDLSKLEPQIVVPPKPESTVNIKEVIGTPLQHGYIGSCANGRLEDLEIAARILKGRKVAKNFRLIINPITDDIMRQALKLGYIETLVDAGAWISSPTCDYCYGKVGAIAAGEAIMSSATLNVPGRMGSVDSEIYIGSAASIAAAAIEGKIVDPRNYV